MLLIKFILFGIYWYLNNKFIKRIRDQTYDILGEHCYSETNRDIATSTKVPFQRLPCGSEENRLNKSSFIYQGMWV